MKTIATALLLSITLLSCDPVYADDVPAIPDISEQVSLVPGPVPANLTATYRNGLYLSYPMDEIADYIYPAVIDDEDKAWRIVGKCRTFKAVVRKVPILWRWDDDNDWQAYTRKTWE